MFSSFLFFFSCYAAPPALHSFPTRRSSDLVALDLRLHALGPLVADQLGDLLRVLLADPLGHRGGDLVHLAGQLRLRSEEHTSELQSRPHLVCRLLLEKKKKNNISRLSHMNI